MPCRCPSHSPCVGAFRCLSRATWPRDYFVNPKGTRGNPTTIWGFPGGSKKKRVLPTRKLFFFMKCLLSLEIHRICSTFISIHGPWEQTDTEYKSTRPFNVKALFRMHGQRPPPPPKTMLANERGGLGETKKHYVLHSFRFGFMHLPILFWGEGGFTKRCPSLGLHCFFCKHR